MFYFHQNLFSTSLQQVLHIWNNKITTHLILISLIKKQKRRQRKSIDVYLLFRLFPAKMSSLALNHVSHSRAMKEPRVADPLGWLNKGEHFSSFCFSFIWLSSSGIIWILYKQITEDIDLRLKARSDSGVAKWFSSWTWNSGPALHPQQGPGGYAGVCPNSPCVLWIWRRHSTVSLEKSFVGVLWDYGVSGQFMRAVCSLYDRSQSLVRVASSKSFPLSI